jgi:hypothetical protein
MFPGCGSAWKKPSSKIILMTTPTDISARRRPSSPPRAPSSSLLARRGTPASAPACRCERYTPGKRTRASPSKFLAKRSACSASCLKSSSALIDRSNSDDEVDRRVAPRLGHRALQRAREPVEQVDVALDRVANARPLHLDGHLVATSPRRATPAVHLRDGRAREGRSSRETYSSPTGRAEVGLDLLAHLGLPGDGRTSSCSTLSSAMTSSGRRSARVEAICPSFTKDGPRSCSTKRSALADGLRAQVVASAPRR